MRHSKELPVGWPPYYRYAAAAALFLIALLLRLLMAPLEGGLAYVTFYPVIVVSFYVLGTGPGVIAVVLSGLAGYYFFIPPYRSFSTDLSTYTSLLFFGLTGILVGMIISKLHAVAAQLRMTLQQNQEAQKTLLINSIALDSSLNGVAIADLQGRLTYVNSAFCRLWAVEPSDAIGRSATDFWSSRDEPQKVIRAIEQSDHWIGELVAKRSDESQLTVLASAAMIRNQQGEPLCMMATFTDITERKHAEQDLKISQQRLEMALSGGDLGLWDWDIPSGKVQYSDRWYSMLGLPLGDGKLDLQSWIKLIHTDDLPRVNAALEIHLKGLAPAYECEHRVRHADGHWLWLFDRGKVVEWDKEGTPLRAVGTYMDITERKQIEEQVRQLAFYDTLTKLPNRTVLDDRLRQAIATNNREGCYGALMFLDLDNFKPLNDAHGHDAGDLLLIEVADRLRACVREMDTVARFGGDEFVVIIGKLNEDRSESGEQATLIAEKIRAAVAKPYLICVPQEGNAQATVEHLCTVSIGVAFFHNHETAQDDILKWADAAMYKAKEAGGNLIRFHEASGQS